MFNHYAWNEWNENHAPDLPSDGAIDHEKGFAWMFVSIGDNDGVNGVPFQSDEFATAHEDRYELRLVSWEDET